MKTLHNDEAILIEVKALRELFSIEVEHLKEHIDAIRGETKEQNEKFHNRINVIELWQSNSMGKIAVIFSIIGVLAGALVTWILKQF